jgi:hypothetical protein
VLAGCGGGGRSSGGTVVVNPSPTPAPSGSATQTPTPGVLSTGEVKPAADASFIAASMELMTTGGVSQTNGVITGGMTSGRITTLDTPQFSGSYNAGYRLADSSNSAVFGTAQLSGDSTRPNGNGIVLFTNISGPIQGYLALYQQTTYTSSVKGSGYTTARYGGTAGWQHTVVGGSSRQTRLNYFGYGSPTPLAGMPRSGIVRFSILGSGNYATDTDLWFLSSSTSNFIAVDFGAGTVSGTVGLSGENFYKSQAGGVGSFRVRGNINGNSLTGSFTDGSIGTSGGVPGQFRLMFVGPNANELILTYVFNDGAQAGVGAAVGVIDPYAN